MDLAALSDASPPRDTPTPADPAVARTERHCRMLERLAEIGMDMAERLGLRAQEWVEGSVATDFVRVSQSVRRSIALQVQLHEKLVRGEARATVSATSGDKARAVRGQVSRLIDETFADRAPKAVNELRSEMERLLSEADDFSDYLDRPVDVTVARLCWSLGLKPQFCTENGVTRMAENPFFTEVWPKPLAPAATSTVSHAALASAAGLGPGP